MNSFLVATLLAVMAVSIERVDALRNIPFALQEVYLNDTRCTGAGKLNTSVLLGRVGECLNFPSASLSSASVRYTCAGAEIFASSANCSGTPVLQGNECTPNTLSDGTNRTCKTFTYTSVFDVTYFSNADCTSDPEKFVSQSGFLTSGVLDQCYLSQTSTSYVSMKSSRDGDSLVTVVYDGSLDCTDAGSTKVVTTRSKIGGGACNKLASAAAGLPGYYRVDLATHDTSAELIGQVDLNQDATNLNAQIVGSSVGVLCGFTVLLVIISMFGVLG